MTLITNYIGDSYIILAADKRSIKTNDQGIITETRDDKLKIFCGENFCIALQGFVETKTADYAKRLSEFVEIDRKLGREELVKRLFENFQDVTGDQDAQVLNFIVSGFYEGELFSFFLDLKNHIEIDCLKDDQHIRFNEQNTDEGELFCKGMIYLVRLFRDKKLFGGFANPNLREFSMDDLLEGFKFVYSKFDQNENYNSIGSKMDYCLISVDEIEVNLTQTENGD